MWELCDVGSEVWEKEGVRRCRQRQHIFDPDHSMCVYVSVGLARIVNVSACMRIRAAHDAFMSQDLLFGGVIE